MNKADSSPLNQGFWASAALVFLLVLFGPLTIYCSNSSDFSFDIFDILIFMLPIAAICIGISFGIIYLCQKAGKAVYSVAVYLLLFLLLGFFVQGNFFSEYLPTINGEEPEWSTFSSFRYVSITIWVLSFAIAFILLKKAKPQWLSLLCKILIAYLAVTIAISCLTTSSCLDRKSGTRISNDYMLDMSSDNNLVIIILDALDADAFSESLEENPEWSDTFEDFTYFDNAMCCYDLTAYSVPFILSNYWFYNRENYWDYVSNSLSSSELLKTLKENRYRIGMYDDSVPLAPGSAELFENVYEERGFSSPLGFCKLVIKLTAYKYMPHDLKPLFYVSPDDITFNTLKGKPNSDHFSWENRAFYDILLNNEIQVCEQNSFRFIHLRGSHGGYRFDRFLNPSENADMKDGIAGSVFAVEKYLHMMKESEVYDNTAIVIMADHGRVGEREIRSNPVLLIKGIDEHHEFAREGVPLSYSETITTFLSLLNGKTADESISPHIGKRYYYEWNVEDNRSWLVEFLREESGKETPLVETGNVFYNDNYGREIEKYSIG